MWPPVGKNRPATIFDICHTMSSSSLLISLSFLSSANKEQINLIVTPIYQCTICEVQMIWNKNSLAAKLSTSDFFFFKTKNWKRYCNRYIVDIRLQNIVRRARCKVNICLLDICCWFQLHCCGEGCATTGTLSSCASNYSK